jgi:hypothetical protein
MSLLPLFEWMEHTPVGATIRSSRSLITLVEGVHLVGVALLIGTILMVDLSLLGLGIRRHPTSRIAGELAAWTVAGLVVMLISGPLMLSSEAVKCYHTPAFWIKMALLLAAVVFHFTIHQKLVRSEGADSEPRAKLIACVSLALWISVALAGKAIAIFPAPADSSGAF